MTNEVHENSTEATTQKRRLFTRRRFLQAGAILLGGTALTVYFGRTPARRAMYRMIADRERSPEISNFEPDLVFEIQEDNTLLINMAKAEMGQGIFTGLAMLAVEELDIALDQVKVIPSLASKGMLDLATGGSLTTTTLYVPMRELAATFREMLKIAAAKQWSMDVSQVSTGDGFVRAGSNRMRYIDVVNATEEWEIPETPPPLRPTSSFKVVGTEQPRIDLKSKVMGKPIFAIDAELPDMLYANVLKCPYIDGTLETVDVAAARAFPGVVEVIQDDDLVAVVAENQYAAEMGKRTLNAQWRVERAWQQAELDEMCTVGTSSPVNIQRDGNARAMLNGGSGEFVKAEYRVAIGVHAHMEPHVAVADVQGDTAFIITGTQGSRGTQSSVATALGIAAENVEVQNSYLGGGFGRRFWIEPAVDAARLSRIMGRPVKVVWDRETEFLCGFVRPSTHHTCRVRLDNAGKMIAMEYNIASGNQFFGILSENVPAYIPFRAILGADLNSVAHGATSNYEIENRDANIWDVEVPYNGGIWRAVGMYPNGFAIESFMNEVAHASGQDPFDFRLAHLQGDEENVRRMREVLLRLREESDWDTDKADGIGRGLAIIEDRRTIAATVIEVKVENGALRVPKVTAAIDPGVVVNPDGVRQQVEGCIMMGIGAALYEETTVKDGQFTATNYHQYPMATLSDTPPEITVIMLEGSEIPSGVGEPPVATIAPAIASAIFDLTGQRLREIPLLKGVDLEAIS